MRNPSFLCITVALLSLGCITQVRADKLITTSYGPFVVQSNGQGQLSSNTFDIHTTTTKVLEAEYTASPGHCSNVIMHFLVDGSETAVSGIIGPGQSSGFFNLGPVSKGAHTVSLQAQGCLGGCNTGTLGSWAGTAQVITSVAVPEASTLLGFSGMLTVAAGIARRRRRQ